MGKTTRPARPEVLVALRRARDFTDRDFAQPLTLDSMAKVANMSKFHFARTFAKVYGETPRTYLTRRRIERAKDMLRAADLTITEICFLVGFESLGSFSSRFRELVGMSPTEYRLASSGAPPIPEELKGKGVTFLQEPIERPYGIEAMFRDDSGKWFSLNQHKRWGG